MTNEEKEVLEAAERVRDYCEFRSCINCIFYVDVLGCRLNIEDPANWAIDGMRHDTEKR